MLNIIVCYKWVIDEAYVKASGALRELTLDRVDYKISDYDRNALEEAVRLQKEHGGSVTAITVGSPGATKGIKDALSRGAEKAFFINDPSFEKLEPSQTSAILADVLKSQIEYDLIICGEGSSDLYTQQVGPRLAEMLDMPVISYVNKISIDGSNIIAERRTEEGIEIISAPLPALVTVLPDINAPRIPGLKDTLNASKKPVVNIGLTGLPGDYRSCLETLSIQGSSTERNCVRFGTSDEDIAGFVDAIIK
ncbi:MAG: electron transfer flavoprotein subunit beta/FixA family protein [Ignavibacteriales bacterium]